MSKQPLSRGDWAGLGLAGGSGIFALGALINELNRMKRLKQESQRDTLPDNALVVDLPTAQGGAAPVKVASPFSDLDESFMRFLYGLGGTGAGYLGAKGIYDHVRGKQLKKETDDAYQDYLATMQRAHQLNSPGAGVPKYAEEKGVAPTPLVDALCKGAAEALLQKQGSAVPAFLARLGRGAAKYGPKAGTAAAGGLGGALLTRHAFTPQETALSNTVSLLKILGTAGILTTGGLMYGNMRRLKKNQDEERSQQRPPDAVALHDVPVALNNIRA